MTAAMASLPVYEPSELDLADEQLGALDYLGGDAEDYEPDPEPDVDDDGALDFAERDYERALDRPWGDAA